MAGCLYRLFSTAMSSPLNAIEELVKQALKMRMELDKKDQQIAALQQQLADAHANITKKFDAVDRDVFYTHVEIESMADDLTDQNKELASLRRDLAYLQHQLADQKQSADHLRLVGDLLLTDQNKELASLRRDLAALQQQQLAATPANNGKSAKSATENSIPAKEVLTSNEQFIEKFPSGDVSGAVFGNTFANTKGLDLTPFGLERYNPVEGKPHQNIRVIPAEGGGAGYVPPGGADVRIAPATPDGASPHRTTPSAPKKKSCPGAFERRMQCDFV